MRAPDPPESVYVEVSRLTGNPAQPGKAWFRRCVAAAFAAGYRAGVAGAEEPEPKTVDDL